MLVYVHSISFTLLLSVYFFGTGLGGGVGTFLAGPLMAELEVCSSEEYSTRDMRRMLEILVPLMYRPAMKASDPLNCKAPTSQTLPYCMERCRAANDSSLSIDIYEAMHCRPATMCIRPATI